MYFNQEKGCSLSRDKEGSIVWVPWQVHQDESIEEGMNFRAVNVA